MDAVAYVIPGTDGPPRDVVLTSTQSVALGKAADLPHEHICLALAYGTAGRPETILDTEKGFVDFERRLLLTNPPGRAQTRKHHPVVPAGDFLLPWLAQAPDGPVVTWRGKPIESFKTAWRKMRDRARLPKTYVAKDIRHTIATEMRSHAVPEAEMLISSATAPTAARPRSTRNIGRTIWAKPSPWWMATWKSCVLVAC